MKVVLLVLSGDSARFHAKLAQLYPGASIETISRTEIENGGVAKRFATLRARQPDVFAIATERLAWQRGQNLFMLFGALAGAREVVMVDNHDAVNKRTRGDLFARAPLGVGHEAIVSATDFAHARRELSRLEQAVKTLAARPHQRAHPAGQTRVVYLRATPGPGTQAGGAASHIKGVVEALRGFGVELEIISNDASAGFDSSGLKVIPPEPVGGTRALFDIHNNLVFTRAAVPLIERAQPDFIYQRYARFSWVGVAGAVRTGRPLFLEYNGSEVWVGKHWDRVGSLALLERYEQLNLQAAARIFVVSEVERRNLEARGIAAEKIVLNPNAVDVQKFRPGIGGVAKRSELGIKETDLLAGFVGTFGPWHGVVELAKAIKKIPESVPLRFLFVGSGSLHGEVERLLRAERESGRVIFTGVVEHDSVPVFLDACDILVAPHVPLADGSEFFGSPTKLFEYMAMGKAIVASRLGQIGEVLSDHETALLVPPGGVNDLADAMVRLVDSEGMRVRLGENARRAAVEEHTWAHNARRVMDAYESWLSR